MSKYQIPASHLILFDNECPLCQLAVRRMLHIDQKNQFVFAPLKGETAKNILGSKLSRYQKKNTLILIENFKVRGGKKIWIRAKAVFRIYWILGGKWKLVGFFFYFPKFFDGLYRLIARYRNRIPSKGSGSFSKDQKKRFLP